MLQLLFLYPSAKSHKKAIYLASFQFNLYSQVNNLHDASSTPSGKELLRCLLHANDGTQLSNPGC